MAAVADVHPTERNGTLVENGFCFFHTLNVAPFALKVKGGFPNSPRNSANGL